jgi:hypothetical protein
VIGQRFGRLVVVADLGSRFFACACDCNSGATKRVRSDHLLHGRTRSCGCLKSESTHTTKHGGARKSGHLPEYDIWAGIISRCTIQTDTGYPRYGGSGITICARWRNDFAAFLADVGRRPSPKHSIDRYPNQAGNYEPGNCRWATKKQQARNMRSNRILELNGRRAPLQEWAEITGMLRETIAMRIRRGWSVEEALTRSVA